MVLGILLLPLLAKIWGTFCLLSWVIFLVGGLFALDFFLGGVLFW